MKENPNIKSIGLITPYTGANLGDAVIQNIQKRIENAEIFLITFVPKATAALHGIPSFPLVSDIEYGHKTIAKASKACNLLNRSIVKKIIVSIPLFYPLVSKFYHFSEKIIKEIIHISKAIKLMKRINLLMVSGGGQLDDYWGGGWVHPYALFKWGLIAKIFGVKYVFLSVGYCTLDTKLSRFFIRRALRFAYYRSYRDEASKRRLKYLSSVTNNDNVYPDLAFSNKLKNIIDKEQTLATDIVIGISPIAYLSKYWPKHKSDIFKNYILQLSEFTVDIINRGFSILIFTTDAPDRLIVGEFLSHIERNISEQQSNKIYVKSNTNIEELVGNLQSVNYVVASRLHGVLLSHLINRPVLAISYDSKVDTYMSDMELSEYCMDIHKFEKTELLKSFIAMTKNKDIIKKKLKEKVSLYSRKLDTQYDHIFGGHISL